MIVGAVATIFGSMIIADSINNQSNGEANLSSTYNKASTKDNMVYILDRYASPCHSDQLKDYNPKNDDILFRAFCYDFSHLRKQQYVYLSLSKNQCFTSLTDDKEERAYKYFYQVAKANNLLLDDENSKWHCNINSRRLFEIGIELFKKNGFFIKEIHFEPFYSCIMEYNSPK
jgi:hypothetical protein